MTKLILGAGFIVMVVFMHPSVSTIFLATLLGLLLVPPLVVIVSMLREGAPLVIKGVQSHFASKEESFLISVSKESITLEPRFR